MIIIVITLAIVGIGFIPGGNDDLTAHGIFDETGHLLTALLIAFGLRSRNVPVPIWSVLLGGVILDLGHITDLLGYTHVIRGSSRNGTHSLFAIAVIMGFALIDRRRAGIWAGIAIGALTHLWRDMGTGTVPLLWPASDHVVGASYRTYLGVLFMVGVLLIVGARTRPGVGEASGKRPNSSVLS